VTYSFERSSSGKFLKQNETMGVTTDQYQSSQTATTITSTLRHFKVTQYADKKSIEDKKGSLPEEAKILCAASMMKGEPRTIALLCNEYELSYPKAREIIRRKYGKSKRPTFINDLPPMWHVEEMEPGEEENNSKKTMIKELKNKLEKRESERNKRNTKKNREKSKRKR